MIYRSINVVMSGHWLSGYGYGSSYEICMNTIHFPNLQNGVLDFIMQQGIISFILLLLIIFMVFHYASKYKTTRSTGFSVAIILYTYAILGMVEITIGQTFLVLLFMFYTGCLSEQIVIHAKNVKKAEKLFKENANHGPDR